MKGDFSRLSGVKAKRKHYSGVLKQQGRVQLDSDWNEFISIIDHQRKTRTADVIGKCGAPIHNSGFKILHPGDDLDDLLLSTGRMYAGGLLCETTPSSKLPITEILSVPISDSRTVSALRVDDVNIDGEHLEMGQWVQIVTDERPEGRICRITMVLDNIVTLTHDISSLSNDHNPFLRRLLLYSEQPDFPMASKDDIDTDPQESHTYLVYLDAWERHITTIEDPELTEAALGGPDTDTRSKIIAQVKVQQVGDGARCEDETAFWHTLTTPPDGRLSTRLEEPGPDPEPCELGKSGGYHGIENHLYRVEIHDGGSDGKASFKWSRDNASQAYAIDAFVAGQPNQIKLSQKGKDDVLKLKELDWIEITGDTTGLDTDNPGTIARIRVIHQRSDGYILELNRDVTAHKDESNPKLRRWDTSPFRPDEAVTFLSEGPEFQLEDGIIIEFSGENFRSGDYWVFSARALTGEIEILEKARPMGVRHHYCRLAIVNWREDGTVDIEDCRPEFPPLAELPEGGVITRERGCCTVTVGANGDYQDIQQAIDALGGWPGTVCILPGAYEITKPIEIKGKWGVTIKGCKRASPIINLNSSGTEVFKVEGSMNIKIQGLWCISYSSQAVTVKNTANFQLSDCFVVAGGLSDAPGAVTLKGYTANTALNDNLILGAIGVRLDNQAPPVEDTPETPLNRYAWVNIENNNLIAVQSGVFQAAHATSIGLNLKDNVMAGVSLPLLSKACFPEALFSDIREKGLYDPEVLDAAVKDRSEGVAFEVADASQLKPILDLYAILEKQAAQIKLSGRLLKAEHYPTAGAVVNLIGRQTLAASIANNFLIGARCLFATFLAESDVTNNVILAAGQGVLLRLLDGLTINGNLIISKGHAIQCIGEIVHNLAIDSNRIYSQWDGITFGRDGSLAGLVLTNMIDLSTTTRSQNLRFQWLNNVTCSQNQITAQGAGISLDNPRILLQSFTALGNTISGCKEYGILLNVLDENQFLPQDTANYQRIIQRNAITVRGTGIEVNASDCRILDNDIKINAAQEAPPVDSRGIVLRASNCEVGGNAIHGVMNPEMKLFSYGGIYLDLSMAEALPATAPHQLHIHHNKIFGGRHNGIEIASDITGLDIEENQIAGMGLNGIAVQQHVLSVDDLRIKGNHISDCHNSVGVENWWNTAAIVLTGTQRTLISGNVIWKNGRRQGQEWINAGGLYAERIREIEISGNQFIDNGGLEPKEQQAVIHLSETNPLGNEDIQITGNLIKGSYVPALKLGNNFCIQQGKACLAIDRKTIITENHFKAPVAGPIVWLSCSLCIFSSNFVECGGASAVDLGYGWYVTANGNVVSGRISGAGEAQQILANIVF